MERSPRHAGADPLARPPRGTHGAALAHPDRLLAGPPAAGQVPLGLRAGDAPEPCGKPGLYRFYLAHTWSTSLLPDGDYRIEVEASDLYGNTGSLALPFTLVNDL